MGESIMGKKRDIKEMVTLISLALKHKIGSLVNPNEIYSEKYKKESDSFLKQAIKISLRQNWNKEDKAKIKELLKKKLKDDLEKGDFIDDKKFSLIDKEIDDVLNLIELN